MEIKKGLRYFLILLTSLVNITFSVAEETAVKDKAVASTTTLKKNQMKYYQGDNLINQIPYFDNRFRIDAQLDEITLLFYRKSGSRPIILVRPDGSKLRIENHDKDQVQWFDDSTFDMIKIKKPMPGPWQVIGDVLSNSQIMVVSDIKIVVDPLPEIILSGETLKVVGQLFNGDELIEMPSFRQVVKLDVHFYSTNNSAYDNFGASALKLTSFRDDGKHLDEYAADGLFTGEFILDFAAGEWQPVFFIKLPMVTRELRQKPIMLHKTPIHIAVKTSEHEDIPHLMTLTIDPTYVIPDSLVFQGKITFPDRQVEPFSIMDDQQGETRSLEISFTESGVYRVNVNAFGKTKTGREFRLVMPEFNFNVEENMFEQTVVIDAHGKQQIITPAISAQLLADNEAKFAQEQQVQQQLAEEKQQQTVIMIAVGNGVVIIIALVLFMVMRKKKK